MRLVPHVFQNAWAFTKITTLKEIAYEILKEILAFVNKKRVPGRPPPGCQVAAA